MRISLKAQQKQFSIFRKAMTCNLTNGSFISSTSLSQQFLFQMAIRSKNVQIAEIKQKELK